eukprot:4385746-Prymnesium_polylepis.1
MAMRHGSWLRLRLRTEYRIAIGNSATARPPRRRAGAAIQKCHIRTCPRWRCTAARADRSSTKSYMAMPTLRPLAGGRICGSAADRNISTDRRCDMTCSV